MNALPDATIFDLRKYSVHDGPGIRTTVFLKGCPLRCAWCHNPEGRHYSQEVILRANRCIGCGACQDICPQGAVAVVDGKATIDRALCNRCGKCVEVCYSSALSLTGRELTLTEFAQSIERDRPFYEASGGGVTFSGGEPLMQARFLEAALQICAERRIHTTVDTCGFADWQMFERILPYVDLFLYDLKVIDPAEHARLTGYRNDLILANLRRLSELNKRVIVRIPIIPGFNDRVEQLERAGRFLASLPVLEGVDLLPYHASATEKYAGLGLKYPLGEIESPSEAHLLACASLLVEHGLPVSINGVAVGAIQEQQRSMTTEVIQWQ